MWRPNLIGESNHRVRQAGAGDWSWSTVKKNIVTWLVAEAEAMWEGNTVALELEPPAESSEYVM